MDIKQQVANIRKSSSLDPRFKKYDEDTEITDNALDGVNKLFNSILPHFPAWRQSCPTDDDLSRLKLVWTKALLRNKQKTGHSINLKAGITACEESDSDWLPSVGKFIKWCDQNDDVMEFADRAYNLFIRREQQIDSVGRMVTASHSFELRQLKAAECKKGFIELYLKYSADNEIKPLDEFAITETVELTKEQQKAKDKRIQSAQSEFFSKFDKFTDKNPNIPVKVIEKVIGVKQGSLKTYRKTPAQLEEEKQRQLKSIKDML